MTDILEIIKKFQEMYGDDVITTADKINRPDPKPIVKEIEAINEFVRRNPKADGGQLVAPSVDGSRPGYGGTSELDKATKYFTDGEFTKFNDIKGFKSDDPNFKKYKKIRDQIRHNINYHGGKFVEPGTTYLVDQKTIDLENFLKNKKSIKQSVLIKKLEDLGYTNPKEYVNAVAFNNPNLEVIRDVEKIIPERESKIYSKKELQKATEGEHKKDPKRITKSKYDALPSKQKEKIQMKLRQHGGTYLGPNRQIKDPLPVDVQKEIKFKFAGDYKGTWDFDNFKYGIEGIKDVNSRLYDAIKRHVNEPKPWRYAGAQLRTPEGWMMAQMDRAYRQGNKNYKPIYRTINGAKKIVGFIDNTEAGGGKKYISAKEFIKGNDADGVLFSDPKKGHVDYANTKKFNSIALKVHGSPSKVITDILGKGGVEMFTESGKAKVQLKHVLGYLIDTKGLDKTIGGMVRHHKGGVFGAATQDYQILNKVINSRITGIEDRIRADEILPKDIAKLKKWGASVTHKGVTYGGGPKTAIGGLKEIENLILKGSQDVELYGKKIKGIEKWNKKDFTEFNKYLQSFCGYGKSTGGRIGFGGGSCSPEVAKRNFLLATNDVSTRKVTGEAAEQIAKNAGKVVAKAGSKSALASILGPAGIGIDLAYEVGSIGFDMATDSNVSLKQALQNNWLTGGFIKGTGQEEYNKGLVNFDSSAKPMATIQNLIEKIESEEKNLERMKKNLVRGDYTGEAKKEILAKQEALIKNLYNDFDKVARKKTTSPGHPEGEQVRYLAFEEGSPERIAYDQAKQEYDSIGEAKALLKKPSKYGFEQMIKKGAQKRPVPFIDYSLLPEQYGKYSKRELDKRLKKIGDYYGYGYTPYGLGYGMQQMQPGIGDMKYNKDLGYRQVAEIMADSEATDRIAQAGGVSKLASGGLANLTNTIPPESGPMSQGLRSLYNNGRKL